jgi:Phosphoglycerol transferase and related proteins, alkaline phosphatase superfamily
MVKLRRRFSLFFYFAVCWLFTLLVLVHLSALHWHVFLPLLLLALIQALLTGLMLRFGKLQLTCGLTGSAIVAILAFFLLDREFFPALVLAFLFGYLSLNGIQRRISAHLWLLLILSVAAGTLYDLYLTVPDPAFILWTLLAELVCLSGFLLTDSAVQSRWLPGIAGIFLLGAAVLSLAVSLLKPVLLWIYNMFFIVVLKNVLYALASGYWALLSHLATRDKSQLIRHALQGSNLNQDHSRPPVAAVNGPDFRLTGILTALAAAVIVFIAVWLKLRHKKLHPAGPESSNPAIHMTDSFPEPLQEKYPNFPFLGHLFPPRDPVRRTVFLLQRQAEKSGDGRHPGETLTDWLNRLSGGIPDSALIRNYQKVRYGHVNLSRAEWNRFRTAASRTYQLLKERARKRKEQKAKGS